MGVNVTQLLNEEIKVIVEGGDNIATKTELNAGLDLKANKVVGGVFNGMDLKAAAEKLNTDKQNIIVDSGWVDISLINVESTTVARMRKVGQVVTIQVKAKRSDDGDTNYVQLYFIPVGYRTAETFGYAKYGSSGNGSVYTGAQGNDLYIFVPKKETFYFTLTYITN